MARGYPIEYEKYNTQYAGEKEIIGAMLWDTQTYTSDVTTSLSFFNAVRATLDLGNMRQAGALPAPEAFLIRAIRFYVKQNQPLAVLRAAPGNIQTGSAIDNVAQLINTGVLSIVIAAKNYGIYPLWKIPAGGGVKALLDADGDVSTVGVFADYGQAGGFHARNAFTLARPLFLAPQINFRVDVTWPAPLTLTTDITVKLTVALEGDLIRPVQ